MVQITPSFEKKLFPRLAIIPLLVCSILSGGIFLSFAQEKKDKDLGYEIAVSAISIAVTVRDKKGRFINDLTEEDFRIYENNKRRDITYFNHDYEAPLSLTVLLDVSGSMALLDRLKESKEALEYLIKYLLGEQDEISLLIFADGEVEVAMNFSTEKNNFLSILERTEAYGQTALNDAVAVSPEFANKGEAEKRALLLITDGIENDSEYSPEQAIEVARRVDIPIYTIGYKIPLSEQYLKKYKRSPETTAVSIVESLGDFSRATGGKAFFLDYTVAFIMALREIVEELSHQYIIGYTSYTDPNSDYRKIRVVTSNKKYRVRTREGYYSGANKESVDSRF